jgi:RNA polymerase sigma-70 factor (ECF subfamily)
MSYLERPRSWEGRAAFPSHAPSEGSPEGERMTRAAIGRAKEGDGEALRFLYVRYSGPVYRYVRGIVRDNYEAEDITQLVFAKLITNLVKYDERGLPFFAWLRRFARNLAIDYMRALKSAPMEKIEPETCYAHEGVVDRARTLQAALATLSDDQRRVVLLRHLVGLSPGEIAEHLGRSESSIHGLHHRGRLALRRELTRQESAPCTSAAALARTLHLAA